MCGAFYNPNIHPFTEYERRLQSMQEPCRQQGLKIIGEATYDPVEYFQHITFREPRRCRLCYQLRLQKTAQLARSGKFDYFSTSLLVSPFQKHELIKEAGEMAAEQYGVAFLYRDYRADYRETIIRSKAAGLTGGSTVDAFTAKRSATLPAKRKRRTRNHERHGQFSQNASCHRGFDNPGRAGIVLMGQLGGGGFRPPGDS